MKKTNLLKSLAVAACTAILGSTLLAAPATVSAEEKLPSISLTNSVGLPGKLVTVQIQMDTQNTCNGYDVCVEFDSDLDFQRVNGVSSYYNEDNLIYMNEFTSTIFKDGEVASISFLIPEDAPEGTTYEIKFYNVVSFGYNDDYEYFDSTNGSIQVAESKKEKPNYMIIFIQNNFIQQTCIGLRGDSNNDNKLNIYDAANIAKNLSNSSNNTDEIGQTLSDVNEDGTINIYDAAYIAKYLSVGETEDWSTVIK